MQFSLSDSAGTLVFMDKDGMESQTYTPRDRRSLEIGSDQREIIAS